MRGWDNKLFAKDVVEDDAGEGQWIQRYTSQTFKKWGSNPRYGYLIDNYELIGRLEFKCLDHDGAIFRVLNECVCVYMFRSDLEKNIPLMVNGVLGGRFTWRKAGNSIGIYRLGD